MVRRQEMCVWVGRCVGAWLVVCVFVTIGYFSVYGAWLGDLGGKWDTQMMRVRRVEVTEVDNCYAVAMCAGDASGLEKCKKKIDGGAKSGECNWGARCANCGRVLRGDCWDQMRARIECNPYWLVKVSGNHTRWSLQERFTELDGASQRASEFEAGELIALYRNKDDGKVVASFCGFWCWGVGTVMVALNVMVGTVVIACLCMCAEDDVSIGRRRVAVTMERK